MKRAPIIAALDLWSIGHSAGEIARMLGFPNHKHVTRIVAQARKIRDPRAVLHAAKNGRLIGRAGHRLVLAAVEVVPSSTALACKAGHPQIAANVIRRSGHCRLCKRLRERRR